ncbi:UvrD-helicase domain-containing protein, partial [Lysobacter sp. D1-1-M9]|uniref:UvrD-helicase domain-containing protein n=2 Tax=Novilysobacter longmucuonensis TaxID=3098603 RepID=UPI0039830DA3
MNAEGHPAPIDPYLDVPLDGLQLIEASAGTGKTYTLATLVTRLVIERGLRVSQILAVTFTEAATQELRERLRQRLALAARVAERIAAGPSVPGDSSGAGGAETELTRTLIERQLQHEDAASLRARLQRAAHEIDLAAVFTIHGFCARVLGEHALETGQAFVRPEMIGSDRELRDEVAHDLWRALGAAPASAELLQAQWSGPDQLATDLGGLLRAPQLLPALPEAGPDPLPRVHGALETLREVFVRYGEEARTALDAAIAGKVIDGRKARAASYDKAWEALAAGLASGRLARTDDHLDKLTPTRLRECAKAGAEHRLPTSPLFDALADWFAADDARAQWLDQCGLILVHRLRDEAVVRLARLKRVRRVQTFDDLIDGVAAALDAPHGEALAEQLRARYAVALVDEFQDTDARQWTIFERVFGAGNLFLIGDPKQAIYRFRGGDVHTYLAAADQAVRAPALGRNFRSRPALLRAVGALYRHAGEAAFVDPRIRFQAVQPGGRSSDADFQRDGREAPALTVRVLPPPDDGRKQPQWSAPESRELATRACVAEILALLGEARAGRASIGPRPVQAGDIAVLVRSHDEAARMQAGLGAAGIAAVAAGRQSLFATAQAIELLTVFEALLQPGDEGRLRAALATVLLGLDAEAVARLDEDPGWQQTWQSRALGWRERWQRHGPLALVADMCALHAPRLLGLVDGERRLSNLLQIGEALQDADARALGLHGLVDWLRTRIRDADPNDEQQQLRLESDARRVQIVTLHKSKGLEYPLVFLPFAGIGKEPRSRRWCEVPGDAGRVLHLRPDDETVAAWRREECAEDARLLYVGLTRAQQALWLASGPLYKAADTPLAAMLADLRALSADNEGAVVIDDGGAPPTRLAALPPQHAAVEDEIMAGIIVDAPAQPVASGAEPVAAPRRT